MSDEILIDLKVTKSLFSCNVPVVLALTDMETSKSHGIIRFSSYFCLDSEPLDLFDSLKSRMCQTAENRKRIHDENEFISVGAVNGPKRGVVNTAKQISTGHYKTNDLIKDSNERIYTCDLCGRQSHVRYRIARHIEMVHNSSTESNACELCPFSTKYPENLRRHYVNVHKMSKESVKSNSFAGNHAIGSREVTRESARDMNEHNDIMNAWWVSDDVSEIVQCKQDVKEELVKLDPDLIIL